MHSNMYLMHNNNNKYESPSLERLQEKNVGGREREQTEILIIKNECYLYGIRREDVCMSVFTAFTTLSTFQINGRDI